MRTSWTPTVVLIMALCGVALPVQGEIKSGTDATTWKAEESVSDDMSVMPELRTYEPLGSSDAGCGGDTQCGVCEVCMAQPGFFGGADYLYVQPHFSEAVAFARGTQGLTFFGTEAARLDFDYSSSMRAFLGYRLAGGDGQLKFTYWNLQGDVDVDGVDEGPGQFIVDPFNNIVGSVTIIDPSNALFGNTLTGGDAIHTHASVDVNAYDIDLSTSVLLRNPAWQLDVSGGIRIADVSQFYESIITTNGAFTSGGEYFADFVGAGPRVGFETRRVFGPSGNLAVHVNSHGNLLLGTYDVASFITPQPGFDASQEEQMTKIVPVLELEVGASWRPTDRILVSSGWLTQSWIDLGTSGGTFAGLFAGADDANIMSFDGFFFKGEYAF